MITFLILLCGLGLLLRLRRRQEMPLSDIVPEGVDGWENEGGHLAVPESDWTQF